VGAGQERVAGLVVPDGDVGVDARVSPVPRVGIDNRSGFTQRAGACGAVPSVAAGEGVAGAAAVMAGSMKISKFAACPSWGANATDANICPATISATAVAAPILGSNTIEAST